MTCHAVTASKSRPENPEQLGRPPSDGRRIRQLRYRDLRLAPAIPLPAALRRNVLLRSRNRTACLYSEEAAASGARASTPNVRARPPSMVEIVDPPRYRTGRDRTREIRPVRASGRVDPARRPRSRRCASSLARPDSYPSPCTARLSPVVGITWQVVGPDRSDTAVDIIGSVKGPEGFIAVPARLRRRPAYRVSHILASAGGRC